MNKLAHKQLREQMTHNLNEITIMTQLLLNLYTSACNS